ncbi:hypothetical protein [Streptomyces sp. NPDC052496]|uniref:hypothetical protein n=1 Tax=Streptomyces sp. NPDC052496 TaxID=3154951 RepID=UPI0034401DA0
MTWFISSRRHARLTTWLIARWEHADARIRAVQLRLARVKNERDLADWRSGLLAERVDRQARTIADLERALEAAEQRAGRLDTDLNTADAELTDLRRVEVLLHQALDYYTAAIDEPVHVLQRAGRLIGLYRTHAQAAQAVRRLDPDAPDLAVWKPRTDDGPGTGWWHHRMVLPELAPAPSAAALEAHYREKDNKRTPQPVAALPAVAEEHDSRNPAVIARHLSDGCPACTEALRELDAEQLVDAHQAARLADDPDAAELISQEVDRRMRAANSGVTA